MTMQLIIGIGIDFLKQLVASTGTNPDAGQVAIIMCATIILAVISHGLPQMVAGMVLGGGHNGAIGGMGMMTLFAAGMTGAGIAARMSGHPAAAVAAGGAADGAKMLQDRISAAVAAMRNQQSQASSVADTGNPGGGAIGGSFPAGGSTAGGSAAANPIGWPGRRSRSAGGKSSLAGAPGIKPTAPSGAGEQIESGTVQPEPPEPPPERPMSPDEQRGFGPDGNGDPNDSEQIS
jgi:type IV secretory pathway TrbL component